MSTAWHFTLRPQCFRQMLNGIPRTQEGARAQCVNHAQYVEERLRNGIPPVEVAGIDAVLALAGMSLAIVTHVAGYRRTSTCQNTAWDGYDLTR